MLRSCLLLFGLVAATTVVSGGCRSCSTCHDYGPPVANCDCHACGTHRAGSASEAAYPEEQYYETEGEVVDPEQQQIDAPTLELPASER